MKKVLTVTSGLRTEATFALTSRNSSRTRSNRSSRSKLKIIPDDAIVWSRTCTATTTYLNYYETITVGDCYELYELLKGRNTAKNSYSQYSDYNVTLSLGAFSQTITVSALTEREATDKAKAELIKQFKAQAVKA